MIDLDDYPSLVLYAHVVRHLSFSAAAREAKIAKSAVSRRVAQLEEKLGVRLLRRSTRALSVTDEGLRVYEQCVAMLAAAGRVAEVGRDGAAGVRGTLRVNAPVTFAQLYLSQALALFLARHPAVNVELATDDRLVDVVDGGFDVVVRIGRLSDSSLYAKKLASDRLVVCASPAYLAAHGTPVSPSDLVHHECLHYSLVSRAAEWRFRGAEGPLSIPTRGRFEASNGTALREAAVAGAGLAVLPFFMVAREVASGELQLVLQDARRASIGIYALTAHKKHAPPRVRAFLEFAKSHFASADWIRERGRTF